MSSLEGPVAEGAKDSRIPPEIEQVEVFACTQDGCGKQFATKKSLERHTRERVCRFCHKRTNCAVELAKHTAKHSFTCVDCGAFFNTFALALVHAQLAHYDHHECGICEFTARTKELIEDHKVAAHGYFRCIACSELSESQEKLSEHITETHDGNAP